MAGQTEARIVELGITLPQAAAPAGSYVPFTRTGDLLFTSGQIPVGPDGIGFVGKLGDTMSLEDGQQAARQCALNILAQAKAALGDLDKIIRVVKLVGFVNSTPDFGDQPKVINGASDIMVEILGDRGRHARSAVGVASLPFGVAVEVEAILEVE
ncbi:MAG: hypothetical protein C0606_13595 [Hyphomicrobiales bacterium]|nr:MAG: hypothetical protein C0606_13595 [Hyphomicrobiales bacterium]